MKKKGNPVDTHCMTQASLSGGGGTSFQFDSDIWRGVFAIFATGNPVDTHCVIQVSLSGVLLFNLIQIYGGGCLQFNSCIRVDI